MGVYERWILPGLLDLAMRDRSLHHYRQQTIETAQGLVLEIGVGSGLNLRLYSREVDHVCGIDPSPELLRLAHKRTAHAVVPVSLIRASAEHLPFGVAVFDNRNDMDIVLDLESGCGARGNAAGSQTGRAIAFRRARVISRKPDSSLAASVDAVLETDRRGLSPRSQDGRPDPRCGVPNQCRRNRL